MSKLQQDRRSKEGEKERKETRKSVISEGV
jgi:hypothetical protein